MSFDNHDNFLRKNAALSKAYEIEKKDSRDKDEEDGKAKEPCFKCQKIEGTMKYKINLTEASTGSASYGVEFRWYCPTHAPKGKKPLNQPQDTKKIKSMLKGMKRGLR